MFLCIPPIHLSFVGEVFREFQPSKNKQPIFEPQIDQIPPQNLEAEEAVLGGILLDPDALSNDSNALNL